MSEERATGAVGAAAHLVDAVRRGDAGEVHTILTTPGLDWMALAVVLADQVTHAPARQVLDAVLGDLSAGVTPCRISRRYGLPVERVKQLADDNSLTLDSPNELTNGHWQNVKGVQVWVPNEREGAA